MLPVGNPVTHEPIYNPLSPEVVAGLLKARKPSRQLGAFLRLVRATGRTVHGRAADPVARRVDFAVRTAAGGAEQLLFVEFQLPNLMGDWESGQCADFLAALERAELPPGDAKDRLLARVAAVVEIRAGQWPPGVGEALEYLLHIARPPLGAPEIFLDQLRVRLEGASIPEPDALERAKPGPAAAALLGDSPARAAALLRGGG